MPQLPSSTTFYETFAHAIAPLGLMIYGALHPARTAVPDLQGGTLLLLGAGADFWPRFQTGPEAQDGAPHPIDRWSERVIGALATQYGARPVYPFGGPPYAPFVAWALASGRAFTSPSQMLVHDTVGMLISYRGALHFEQSFDIPAPPQSRSPCESCVDRPCLSACPAHALVDRSPGRGSYDLAACHDHLDKPQGTMCLSQGCLARRACPFSAATACPPEQMAHHMRYFHPR